MPEKSIDGGVLRQIVQPVFESAPALVVLRCCLTPPSSLGVRVREIMAHGSFLASDDDNALQQLWMSRTSGDPRVDSLADGIADDGNPPFDRPAEQAMLRELIALLRPRSGRLDDVPQEMALMLMGEVSKVIAMLRADGWSSSTVASLERLLDAVRSDPADRAAFRLLLEALADFASPVECWWKEAAIDPDAVF
jgi:hypothetical protein